MSFFKDLFSSLSSNKTSEKPSQNTELLTNSAKRVIPSIADYSYRNTGLNTMTFEDLKDLLKNDVFEKKLNRACGDNIVYTDMLKNRGDISYVNYSKGKAIHCPLCDTIILIEGVQFFGRKR